jgi:hypothetical protein
VSDWQPPGAPSPGPPPPTPAPPPAGPSGPNPYVARPPAWGVPYGAPPAPALPWYRSTVFLVLGGLAMLGLGGVVGAAVTFLAVGAAEAIGEEFGSSEVVTYGPDGDLRTFGLGAGQCAAQDLFEAHAFEEGDHVPCEARHAIEHYATVEPPTLSGDGGRFARGDLANFADSACYLAFEPYVGLVYADSDFDYLAVVPSEVAWDEGTRTVHCVLFEYDGSSSTGSANGSRR